MLDRFCKFAGEFPRACPFSVGEGLRLTQRDRSFSSKNGTEEEKLLLTIQAFFAHEFTTAECANGLLEPCRETVMVEVLIFQGNSQPLRAKSAHLSVLAHFR